MKKTKLIEAGLLVVLAGTIVSCESTSPSAQPQATAHEAIQNNAAAVKTGADSPLAITIAFDRNKVSHDAVVAAVSSVFLAHGYKLSAHQESVYRVQEGQPANQVNLPGRTFIDTELRPPLGGPDSQDELKSKPWHYKAVINDDNVELSVYVKDKPIQFMGVVFDESQTPLRPPDMKAIVRELQTKLQ
jgi:hypothetical protein